jgi:hypothetical protein
MSHYRQGKNELVSTLVEWDKLMPGRMKIHLIACGGTALTLLGYKESTKDVDFIVPVEKEYELLIQFLIDAGYKQESGSGWLYPGQKVIYDLYKGKRVFTTELLSSPLEKDGNKKILELKKIYLGVLNPIDWIITKMFRGSPVDREDCLTLARHEAIDLKKFEARFRETAKYDISEDRLLKNLAVVLRDIKGLKVKK